MLDGMKQLAKDCPVEVEGGTGASWGAAKQSAATQDYSSITPEGAIFEMSRIPVPGTVA
jgi:hypothetical protein